MKMHTDTKLKAYSSSLFIQFFCYFLDNRCLKKFSFFVKTFLNLQGMLTNELTEFYDGLVDNLRTLPQLICPRKTLAKFTTHRKI